jgi:hypothetical protein
MNRHDRDPHHLRDKSDNQICQWIAGHNDDAGHGFRLVGMHELQRRLRQPDAIRSWIAIGISVIALAVALLSKFCQ